MGDQVKLTKEEVDNALNLLNKLIDVANNDQLQFELILSKVLTDGNVGTSKKLKALQELQVKGKATRAKTIADAVEEAKKARALLQGYAEAFGIS